MHKTNDYIRVTEVLRPYQDFGPATREQLDAAADRGTLVHELCERHLKGEAIAEIPPAAASSCSLVAGPKS